MKQPLIGLEIHGYLETKEKLFCSCKNEHDMKMIKPNTNICPICTGQPGAKPQLTNKTAINKALQIALILNCKPNTIEDKKPLIFQRKHYDWPDMPHGYQKTMSGAHSKHLAEHGKFLGIRIREIHLEEDPAAWNPETGKVDYNRAGVPLIEIVTEPDFHSSEETEIWLRQLVLTLSYIKALNKDAGIKADVNVNIKGLSERAEIKNVNSISEITKAIDSELIRHEKEKPIKKETRRWNSEKEITELMRSKETHADYRFIQDPDLPAIKITKTRIKELTNSIPETPQEKLNKIIKKHKINKKDAEILTKNLEIVELFEQVIKKVKPEIALKWITTELFSILNYNKTNLTEVTIDPEHLTTLIQLVESHKITPLKGKDILRKFIPKSFDPNKEANKSAKIQNPKELTKIIQDILKQNKKSVEDFKSGEQKALNFLIGKVMHKTNKNADYQVVREILVKELN